jgi:hypothetical protein
MQGIKMFKFSNPQIVWETEIWQGCSLCLKMIWTKKFWNKPIQLNIGYIKENVW